MSRWGPLVDLALAPLFWVAWSLIVFVAPKPERRLARRALQAYALASGCAAVAVMVTNSYDWFHALGAGTICMGLGAASALGVVAWHVSKRRCVDTFPAPVVEGYRTSASTHRPRSKRASRRGVTAVVVSLLVSSSAAPLVYDLSLTPFGLVPAHKFPLSLARWRADRALALDVLFNGTWMDCPDWICFSVYRQPMASADAARELALRHHTAAPAILEVVRLGYPIHPLAPTHTQYEAGHNPWRSSASTERTTSQLIDLLVEIDAPETRGPLAAMALDPTRGLDQRVHIWHLTTGCKSRPVPTKGEIPEESFPTTVVARLATERPFLRARWLHAGEEALLTAKCTLLVSLPAHPARVDTACYGYHPTSCAFDRVERDMSELRVDDAQLVLQPDDSSLSLAAFLARHPLRSDRIRWLHFWYPDGHVETAAILPRLQP